MKTIVRSKIYLGLIALVSLTARAGTVILQEGGEIGSNKPKSRMTLYLDAGKLRLDSQDEDKKSVIIFDASKQVMWMINTGDNTYREMDKAQIDAMGQQMSKAMAQMQAQIANMPPQQRAMMEEMMKKNMGGMSMGAAAAKPTVTLKELGGEKVGSYNTIHYEMQVNGERSQEIWAAPFDQARMSPADIKTFQDMAKFFESITRNVPTGSYSFANMEQLKGYPVKTVLYESGKPSHEWNLVSAEQKSLDGNLFTLPAGAKKAEMPGMGGGMGGPPGRRMGQ